MAFDLAIVETGNGGDILLKGKDLAIVYGWENMPYLAMFGGNPGFPTPVQTVEEEQRFDWWANSLLFNNDRSLQFNSYTEHTLQTVALNSSGRALIEAAVKKDLEFMKPFADISVSVAIIKTDVVQITIKINKPDNLQEKKYIFIWDATQGGLVNYNPITGEALQSELQLPL